MSNKFFRPVTLVIVLILVFSLSACGGDNSAPSSSPSETASEITAPAGLTVTYDGNGATDGAAPTDSGSYKAGDNVTVLDNTGSLALDGSTFGGWNTSADGSGATYQANDTFAIDSVSVTLYALWVSASASPTDSATGLTVTYDGNGNTGGAVPVDSNTYNSGDTVTVSDNTGSLALDGSTFGGWNTAADGSGSMYQAGDTFAMGDAGVTLYAQWATADAGASPSPSPSPSDTGNAKDTAVPDKTTVAVGGTVSFVVTTSQDVKQIQTYIDGVAEGKHTDYTDNTDTRAWNVSITFTDPGSRKVRFKCTMTSGSTAYVPSSSVVIKVTGTSSYSVTPTSEKDITSGTSVTYTVTTPSSITSVYAVVDGVKQGEITTAASDSGGVKKWTVKITFRTTGTRSVKFDAYNGTTLEKTFPSTALTVVVS